MLRRRRTQRDVDEGPTPAADLDAVLERVVRVARATGAANAGVLTPGAAAVLVRAGVEPSPIPDTAAGRAFLAALAREDRVVRGAGADLRRLAFPGATPDAFLAVRVGDGDAPGVLYLSDKPGGFTDDDQALAESLARLCAAAVAAEGPEAAPAEFVSMISHELRNPVASIRGFGVLLRDHLDQLSEDERREFVEAIVRQADSLSNLIGDVLDVSQMVAGRFHYASVEYDPTDLLRSCVRDVQAAYPSHRIRLDANELPRAHGDPDRLRQAFLNIISNACRYSPERAPVSVTASAGDGRLVVNVKDAGVGIAPADIPRLFQRFERLHREELPAVKGTGLGLFITRQIVEAHGGTITVESEKGRGSTFTIDISGDARFG